MCCPDPFRGRYTAVLAADLSCQALQLSPVIFPGSAVAFNECLGGVYESYDNICIKVVGTVRVVSEMHG